LQPVRAVQIGPEGELAADLHSILVAHATNLPDEPTPFIGREPEVAAITALLRRPGIRLVTQTGVGGTGKTRLALRVGSTLLGEFADGVFFVSLASVMDPRLIASSIAETVEVKEEGGKPLLDTLTGALRDKRLLLLLDNFEHLLDGSPVVTSLLDTCHDLHILVTSRSPLHVAREHEYAVSPLSVPDPSHLPPFEALYQFEAVQLFIDRAQAAKADFELTRANAPAVAQVCSRLDGLPLAIELAAARIKLFPPQALLHQLSSRLRLLTGGARDRPRRQKTLRDTIDWSYNLLSSEDQTLFAQLSVFAGGCSVEAAAAVCSSGRELDILEGIGSLIDKSLLRREGEDEPRFVMLETIREYATERLEATSSAEELRRRHIQYFVALAQEAEPHLESGKEQIAWLHRLETERDNLNVALACAATMGESDLGLQLSAALGLFWYTRGYWSEGRQWLEGMLASGSSDVCSATRLKAIDALAMLASEQGDYGRADELHEKGVALARQTGETAALARLLFSWAHTARRQTRWDHAEARFAEALALYRQHGDKRGIAATLGSMAVLATNVGNDERASKLNEESLALARELDNKQLIGYNLHNDGWIALRRGDLQAARVLFAESLTLMREIGDKDGVWGNLDALGQVALKQGDDARAEALYVDALALAQQLDDRPGLAALLDNFARVAAARHQGARAARLWGAAEAARARMERSELPGRRRSREAVIPIARALVSDATWQAAWNEGRTMSLEEGLAYALGENER
jgi:predicted ATPase